MADDSQIQLEVVYATAAQQCTIAVMTPAGVTIRAAIERSRIGEQFPEIDLAKHRVGIYGRLCKLNDMAADGDRVEIYQPLKIDPKQARRERFQSSKKLKSAD